MTGRIHSIESFGTVDGPGIRFVVFMQGCPMRCLYCHNPDTWDINGGRQTDAEEILAEYERCRAFLKNGGLTVTGGEPLLQKEFVTELFKKAKERGCLLYTSFPEIVEVTDESEFLDYKPAEESFEQSALDDEDDREEFLADDEKSDMSGE